MIEELIHIGRLILLVLTEEIELFGITFSIAYVVAFLAAGYSIPSIIGFFKPEYNRHDSYLEYAKANINTLKNIDSPEQQFGYLRVINPYIFEEMILAGFYDLGFKVVRNNKYSGDGGIDGQVYINGQCFLIQAKRYKSHINLQDVKEFAELCRLKGLTGLFIHTGRTGRSAKKLGVSSKHVDIVSGARMLNLLAGQQFQARPYKQGDKGEH